MHKIVMNWAKASVFALTPFLLTACEPHQDVIYDLKSSYYDLQASIAAKTTSIDVTGTIINEDKILAFVGRKISIADFIKPESELVLDEGGSDDVIILMDAAYKAQYEILSVIHGSYNGNVIGFTAYSHYGYPKFAKNEIVMLYVHEYNGAIVHDKYNYALIHPTQEGRWAYCGDPYLALEDFQGNTEFDRRPLQKIIFEPPIVESVSAYANPEHYNQEDVGKWLVEPIFEIMGDRAVCKMGVYAEELFRIENETNFKPRSRQERCQALAEDEGLNSEQASVFVPQCRRDLVAVDWP